MAVGNPSAIGVEMSNTLRFFLQRSAVLSLYRDVLRLTRDAPPYVRASIRDEARLQLETDLIHNRHADSAQIDFLLSKGREKLEELRKMLMLSTPSPRSRI